MNFQDLLKERVEREGDEIALKWEKKLRGGRRELMEKKERERKDHEVPPYAHN